MNEATARNVIDISKPVLLSIPDASKYFGLSEYAIRRGVVDGKIPHIKSGKKYLIKRTALEELIDSYSLTL